MNRAQQEDYPTVIVQEPGYLQANIVEDKLFVYRSLLVSDDSLVYKPVLDLVGKRKPVTRDVVYGPEMAGPTDDAEWLLYEL